MNIAFSAIAMITAAAAAAHAQSHPAYEVSDILSSGVTNSSRDTSWKPGEGIVMEVSGMDSMPDGRLAVCVRKGDVWLIDGVESDDPEKISFHLFASGLHEPLGLLRDGDSLLVAQRSEVTRLRDLDGDDVADEYLTAADGWNVSGAYHGYTYGPKRDGDGNLWLTLNLDMGDHADNDIGWRGWGGTIDKQGRFTPMAAGMRSPCGLGANREGDMFVSDQQGTWVPTTPIYHLRKGVFFGNPEGIASQNLPGSPLKLSAEVPQRVLYPEAVHKVPELVPPAVWLPYNKMGRSATDILLCEQNGKFGPFDGQLLVGEFTNAGINRVFLEKIGGEYQGACFPFLSGFPAAVVRMAFGEDGSLFVGMTNRGWSSLGNRSYGLQRVRYKGGEPPFEIAEMRAKPQGFELVFTRPVDPESAADPGAYTLKSYTYLYSSAYGSDEMDARPHAITSAKVSGDGLRVTLTVEGLRELYVHELRAEGVRSASGEPLVHPGAYYTLNRIPEK